MSRRHAALRGLPVPPVTLSAARLAWHPISSAPLSSELAEHDTRSALKTQTLDVELSPVDNRALANLCGALDANLRQIESALDVTIARRGATFNLRGATPQIERAATALERFYTQANEPLTIDDIQLGLIELARQDAGVSDDAPA